MITPIPFVDQLTALREQRALFERDCPVALLDDALDLASEAMGAVTDRTNLVYKDWPPEQQVVHLEARVSYWAEMCAQLESDAATLRWELERVREPLVIHFDKRSVHRLGVPCEAGVCK